ncbi:hypothetical protein N9C66_00960 [Akkermansiaceae bacterium]|nr:hypothetical protein [Akkermansiaceae bacterium]
MNILLPAFLIVLPSCARVELPATSRTVNFEVLSAVRSMPAGKGYDASQAAVDRLAASVSHQNRTFTQDLAKTGPTFCSGATYLVFLRTIEKLGWTNSLPKPSLNRLANLDVKDGEEVFGRWNANGPGTAKLFADLNCGISFTSFDHARPGDFLKLWWTEAIGGKESGHLVVYLSQTPTTVTWWSANEPSGYGKKSISKSKIRHHLFSRLTQPKNLLNVSRLSPKDQFLADMLRKDFSWEQVIQTCKVRKTP